MNDLSDLLESIESHEVAAQVNVASDPRTARLAASRIPSVQSLVSAATDWEQASRILVRVLQLTGLGIDPRYENPYDTALFIYLDALQNSWPRLAPIAASAVVHSPNLWWSAFLARHILSGDGSSSVAGDNEVSAPDDNGAVDRFFVMDSRALMPVTRFLDAMFENDPLEETTTAGDAPPWSTVADTTRQVPAPTSPP